MSPPDASTVALWMFLRPTILAKAQELGATPEDLALALTMGTPELVLACAPEGQAARYAGFAGELFTICCVSLMKEQG